MSSSPSPPWAHGQGVGAPGAPLGLTRRERLRALLLASDEGVSLDEIERILEVRRQVAIDDLQHLQMSMRHSRETLLMRPPACTSCGYVFRLDVPKAPSRCPSCKSRALSDPVFKAEAVG
ncbi:MAG TPA: transcriptional regulator [Candidatus Thermoplasmatota archaeon]|nr:transcriptional regulator [Candidatus Thermoplasmatota archaeon]